MENKFCGNKVSRSVFFDSVFFWNFLQPYLVKCFSNIHHFEMQDQAMLHPVLVELHSVEGEIVTMPK